MSTAKKKPLPLTLRITKYVNTIHSKMTDHLIMGEAVPSRHSMIHGEIVVVADPGHSGPGKSAYVRLCSCTKVDPDTGKGKLSKKAILRHVKTTKDKGLNITVYSVKFKVEAEFGIPGAFLITNEHKHKFFLQSATFEVSSVEIIHFDCQSWVYPIRRTKTDRIFFSNTCCLPNQTPAAMVELRREELHSVRGDGTGERKEWERIYEYDHYGDLGNADQGHDHARPILGGNQAHPYPRRIRTGRTCSNNDPKTKSQPKTIDLDIFVPPDEQLHPKKLLELLSNSIQSAVHFIVPEKKSLVKEDSGSFDSFNEMLEVFSGNQGQQVEKVPDVVRKMAPNKQLKRMIRAIKTVQAKFPLPQIIAEDKWAWKDDREFARQMIAGINPARIQRLQEFPPYSEIGEESSIEAAHIAHNLDGLTIEQAMSQNKIFILDHHDYLMPFLNRINTKGICAYASRTLLFSSRDGMLKPVAIELSFPDSWSDEEVHEVFVPASQGIEAALWQLAKTQVTANDSAHHQLISHWLHTHAVVEPFIIATRRQLSAMHPIHQLLRPHFRDTMHINALFRHILLNSGGVLEKTLFTGEVSMELSSELYKEWRFDEQGLPSDLLKRGMAIQDLESPAGVKLIFHDYPYGEDGLDIWIAIKMWVSDFCSVFYKQDVHIQSDEELQAWWSEIRNVGHGDKKHEKWYEMKNLADLIEALTTLIWTSSALHASVAFGQYAYASYAPNRPTLCRKFIPEEGTVEFAEFLRDTDRYYIKMLPRRSEMTLWIALMEVLSQHTSDQEYLGQRSMVQWTDKEEVHQLFMKFERNLRDIRGRIRERNKNPELRNRGGPAKIPYELLLPNITDDRSTAGIIGKGIPNSISI
ncbi:linoleate 9S-lipoxygenase 6-like isoform X1 [Rhodamnia argentea]|uniref:Lipoxygenase n=1 Tax=Rhodamnia argentea TaxID=178133 RepID=A0A8B8QKM2_9MYRT|nr:linoleate 9S-lipoxygenase 6-like isoform X1 [Rhodamnia argentea]